MYTSKGVVLYQPTAAYTSIYRTLAPHAQSECLCKVEDCLKPCSLFKPARCTPEVISCTDIFFPGDKRRAIRTISEHLQLQSSNQVECLIASSFAPPACISQALAIVPNIPPYLAVPRPVILSQ